MDNFDTVVFFGVFVGDFAGIISGAVIDKDDFKIAMSLSENGIETSWEIFFGIIDWNNNRDFGFGEFRSRSVFFS